MAEKAVKGSGAAVVHYQTVGIGARLERHHPVAVDNKDGQLMRPLRHLHCLHLSAPRPIKQVFIRKGASHIPHRFGQHPAVFHLTERRGTNLAGKLRGKIVRVRARPLYIDLIGQGALHGILLRNGRAAVGPA